MFSSSSADDDTVPQQRAAIVTADQPSSVIESLVTQAHHDKDGDNWLQRIDSTGWIHSVVSGDIGAKGAYSLLWQLSTARKLLLPEYAEQDPDMAILEQDVFNGTQLSQDDQQSLCSAMGVVLNRAAYGNWSVRQFESTMRTVLQLEDSDSNCEFLSGALHFWKQHREDVHDTRIADSWFRGERGSGGTSIKWRVDQITNATNISEISDTVALVELQQRSGDGGKIVFEMDKAALEGVLDTLKQIERKIEELSV